MSLDSDPTSPSPSTSRDWFFPSPSPSFIHSSKTPTTTRRKFSTNPRNPKPPYVPISTTTSFHSSSIQRRDPKYAGIRRRIDFARRIEEESPISVRKAGGISEKCEVAVEKRRVFTGLAGFRLKIRWQMAFTVAVS